MRGPKKTLTRKNKMCMMTQKIQEDDSLNGKMVTRKNLSITVPI